jgi:DNA (cytosine-5)-methyltransferase 1
MRPNGQYLLDLDRELIVDNFAGGGGASTGIEMALGRHVDIAINHNPEAVAMHRINHPQTRHYCESVWDVDPREITAGRPVGLVWLSPDCRHFSKAKGGTPVSKEIRGLAWTAVRWAATVRPRIIILENVEEFQTWGPLITKPDGTLHPDPRYKGKTFESFIRQLRQHGYKVEWRGLRACDHGAPTIRTRLFLVARRDGLPLAWPEATHGEPTSRKVLAGMLAPYRTAAECIDFSLPAKSIFDRKKPLAMNTQRRIAKGLWRHVLTSAKPFIVINTGEHPGAAANEPPSALTPFITEHANASSQRTMPADAPLRTVCAQVKGGHFSVVAPILAPLRGTSTAHMGGHSVEQPLSTVSAGGTHHAMAMVHLAHLTHHGDRPGSTPDEPLPTVTGAHRGEQVLVVANLVDMGHGESCSTGAKRWSSGVRSLETPLNSVTASSVPSALTSAFFEQANGGFYDGDGRSADVPISTITSSGANQRLVTACLIKYYSSGGQWQDVEEPMHTLSTKGRIGLVQVIKMSAAALTPKYCEKARQCAELLHQHLPEHFPEPADIVLMAFNGIWWVLVDITLRMLVPRELYRAQGFPDNYIIDRGDFDDKIRPLTKTAQVRLCGNSVCPPLAEALVRAEAPELAIERWAA